MSTSEKAHEAIATAIPGTTYEDAAHVAVDEALEDVNNALGICRGNYKGLSDEHDKAKERIATLEGERDQWKLDYSQCFKTMKALEGELATCRADLEIAERQASKRFHELEAIRRSVGGGHAPSIEWQLTLKECATKLSEMRDEMARCKPAPLPTRTNLAVKLNNIYAAAPAHDEWMHVADAVLKMMGER